MTKRIVTINASTNKIGSESTYEICELEEGEELTPELEQELIDDYMCNVVDVWLEVVEE